MTVQLHEKKQEPLPALSAPHAGQNGAKNVRRFHRLTASSFCIPIPVSLDGFLEMMDLTPDTTSSCLLTSSHVGCQCLASIPRNKVTTTSTTTLATTRTRTSVASSQSAPDFRSHASRRSAMCGAMLRIVVQVFHIGEPIFSARRPCSTTGWTISLFPFLHQHWKRAGILCGQQLQH